MRLMAELKKRMQEAVGEDLDFYIRLWDAFHKISTKKAQRAWYERNKEHVLVRQKKYYAENKEKRKAYSRKYYREHKEAHNASCRSYQLRHKDEISEANRKRYRTVEIEHECERGLKE